MKFAENLKLFRRAFKLSQEKFAKIIGISRAQVANYENNISEPNISTLEKIANFFHVPIESMLQDNPYILEEPIGKFVVKSNLFMEYDSNNLGTIYEFSYRFGAFKDSLGRIIEFIYIGSYLQPFLHYMLSENYSYDAFNEFIRVIYAQLGWKFIDKANTNTYIVVDNPTSQGKYYHIYGNYMSGMKMSEIYDTNFIEAIDNVLKLDNDELKALLKNLLDVQK
ncbi:helix-turn-helix transcriptional regulator [Veillonella sp.]|uniref:helix-turn-helix domain-containing protein n=1 Tax=Veillonella sp. TaxID=1926307 RepID=UPI0025F5B34E|nr:helix-turn-helix transcriptional regulator [Veillonella sp.]